MKQQMNFKSTGNPTDLWMELHLGPQQKCNQFCSFSLFLHLVRCWQDLQGPNSGLCLSKAGSALLTLACQRPDSDPRSLYTLFVLLLLLNCTVLKDLWTNLFYRSEQKCMWGMTAGLQATEIPEKPSVLLLIQRSAWNITMATILTQWKEHAIICS